MTAIKERRTLRLTISFARLLMSKARSHRTSLYILLLKDKKKTTPSNINISNLLKSYLSKSHSDGKSDVNYITLPKAFRIQMAQLTK